MSRFTFFQLATLLVVFLASGSAIGQETIKPQALSGKIEWTYDYAAGQELAKQTGKPLFVVFRCER